MTRDSETGKAALQAVKKIAAPVIDTASGAYFYTSIARVIEEEQHCFIRFRPTKSGCFRGRAETWSRVLEITVAWPAAQTFREAEHWIFYDSRMAKAAAARCVAHELFHILAHDPTSPKRTANRDGRIEYTGQQERDADLFSLVLLGNCTLGKSQGPPGTAEEFLRLIRTQAGWPEHISREELERLAPRLVFKVLA